MDVGPLVSVVVGALISIGVAQVNETMRFRREERRARTERKRQQLASLAEAEARLFETLSASKRIREWTPSVGEEVGVFLAQRNLDVAANELFDDELRKRVDAMMLAFQATVRATTPQDFNEQMKPLWVKAKAVRARFRELRKELG